MKHTVSSSGMQVDMASARDVRRVTNALGGSWLSMRVCPWPAPKRRCVGLDLLPAASDGGLCGGRSSRLPYISACKRPLEEGFTRWCNVSSSNLRLGLVAVAMTPLYLRY